jgi:hypothetical protein
MMKMKGKIQIRAHSKRETRVDRSGLSPNAKNSS